jgi:hypothetical protein
MNAMADSPSVSIIVNCYNYGHFLAECVESALTQTYPRTEVVIVDDGSEDNSREVIASYGDRVVPVLKDNGGQGSAFNVGFEKSQGDIIIFLDADDTLLNRAVEMVVSSFVNSGVMKVHWPLWVVDEKGKSLGGVHPTDPLSEGDLLESVIARGPMGYVWPVTSGNAWARSFLAEVLPVPETAFRRSAESYLTTLAPVFGRVTKVSEPLGTYRMHGGSYSNSRLVTQSMKNLELQYAALGDTFRKFGFNVNVDQWPPSTVERKNILLACEELRHLVPRGSKFIFVQWGAWGPGQIVEGTYQIPFLEKDGQYWGPPKDDAVAIGELERLREGGARYIVFAWSAYWWLDYYPGFYEHLRSCYHRVLENDRVVVFQLVS